MFFCGSRKLDLGLLVYCFLFFVFLAGFYFPLSSKSMNNIFYVGFAIPALIWFCFVFREIGDFLQGVAFFILPIFLLVLMGADSLGDLKLFLYLFFLLIGCLLIEARFWGVRYVFLGFSLVSIFVALWVFGEWFNLFSSAGEWLRFSEFLGRAINPVHFSMLLGCAFLFLWLFYVDEQLRARSWWEWSLGLVLLSVMILICAVVFQSRSLLLGFFVFVVGYACMRREFFSMLLLVFIGVVMVFLVGGGGLAERGLSYRLDIWLDAYQRLTDECNIWLGCVDDGYLFFGKYEHVHSAYFSVIYSTGILGFFVFSVFSLCFLWGVFKSRSKWGALALLGWGGVIATTSGVLTDPKPLWVYFWVPTVMAMLDMNQAAIQSFRQRRLECCS